MVYMAVCHHELTPFVDEKNKHNFNNVLSLNQVILIRTVSNLFTMLSTKMSFPSSNILYNARTLVKSAYQKNIFLIPQPKHMLWVLKRTVSMRRFF